MNNKSVFSNINRFYYYSIVVYALVCFLFAQLYSNLPVYENSLKTMLLSQSIDGTDAFSDKLIDKIINNNSNFIKESSQDSDMRKRATELLVDFKNRNISSLFVLISKEDKFYILLDSDDKHNIQEIQLFRLEGIDEEESLRKAKESNSKQVYIQENIKDLGFTLIKPMLQKDDLSAFLVIDYTQTSYNSLTSLLMVSVKTITAFFALVLFLSAILISYFLRNSYIKNSSYRNPNTGTFYRSYLTDNYEKINFSNYYIALVDIDRFKLINDIYGHNNGDIVINSVIKKISNLLNKRDIFIQYGGEEFLLLISKKDTTVESFKYRAEDIRLTIERDNFKIQNDIVQLTLSIGAFIQSEVASSLQDAIHNADTALYEAKHSGRNRVQYFDISDNKRLYRDRLKEMIESDQLVCHYQPIINLYTNRVHHYEALLRIENDNQIIFPDKILPDLEESYFYSRIGMKVIEYNVKKLQQNSNLKISINLSADDLLNDSILALLFENSDLSKRIFIEILENKSIDYNRVEASIKQLKILGYKICIDDFGAGFSNMNHLFNLSIDYLKLDGSMIKNIHNDKKAHSIIEAITFFCQTNGIEVIAEFVENEEIVEILKGFGIEYGQGWYFDRAKPYDEIFDV
ncbi:diguanylate cyclase/phosphodiesterase (GGDEF & EAL domains) with PAS/PAC sensor(s) [hydrothermal vent metagenome]|uniref:Diguanylate cyclase/phosphodiesterase (GGDEF & EAL domains) with PAS/PAC sensor(S) n=1 Tax=hydrothermal vent metagenome TaxID=652676 RepID=A0A1W1BEA4_9ZZZZ